MIYHKCYSGDECSRLAQANQQASQIEKSVTHLLVATKQLLETLTAWSRGTATENEVSDVYVRLGYEFNIATRAFTGVGVDVSDLGNVPDVLRSILEETLSQEASQASLDRFLPHIRDIIINLLHGLKRKQQKLRQRTGRDGLQGTAAERRAPAASVAAFDAPDELETRQQSTTAPPQHTSIDRAADSLANSIPPRASSVTNGSFSPARRPESMLPGADTRRTGSTGSDGRERRQSTRPRNISQDPPPDPTSTPSDTIMPGPYQAQPPPPPQLAPTISDVITTAAPGPQPRQQDALAALQRGGDLERRASRRFSAYQISKHLGSNSAAMPMPAPQRSPIPNRGRDIRESMNAVRTRGTQNTGDRPRLYVTDELSPSRRPKGREENAGAGDVAPTIPLPHIGSPFGSPAKPSHEQSQPPNTFQDQYDNDNASTARQTAPPSEDYPSVAPQEITPVDEKRRGAQIPEPMPELKSPPAPVTLAPIVQAESATLENSATSTPQPLTLFLQYKTKVKKFVLSEGFASLTIARLQLAFIEKFAWNTHSHGVDLPEIYIQDQVSGVRHELEDLSDIKDHSVLVLNVNDLDEVTRHIDDSFGGLRQVIEGVKSAVDDQHVALQRVSEKQQDTAKNVARLTMAPPQAVSARPMDSANTGVQLGTRGAVGQMTDVHSLRRELNALRKTYADYVSNFETSMANLRARASDVKSAFVTASVPSVAGDSGRSYVNAGKKSLNEDSEKIVNRVDDLQDIVEDLRKDVVSRGVRPLPRQLDAVNKDIAGATTELRKLREYLKREKPIWTKVGEKELDAVCDDQKMLSLQEELMADLEDDLEKASQTFSLVEEATKQQNSQPSGSRSTSRTMNNPSNDIEPHKLRDGVLGEVRALRPNHDDRLRAIERAEKNMQSSSHRDDDMFKKELGSFVEEGKLKNTGGVEETERMREIREDNARKAFQEAQQARLLGLDGANNLEVPATEDGMVSPEPEFVEAEEGL